MERSIVGYRQDEENHWVALLDCGHPRHVRHDPPMVSRPWVLTETGRSSRLGMKLTCVRCDQAEWPDGIAAYKRTAVYDETTLPAGLCRDHQTARGVWARITVLEGALRYRVPSRALDTLVTPELPGVVVPEVLHSVEAEGKVRVFIEFYR